MSARFYLACGVCEVCFGDDVVSVEHAACLVTGIAHRDALRDAAPNHVPHSGAPEIVEQQAVESGCRHEGVPSSTGSLTNPFRYTGREFDSDTGLYYYRARYYDPTVGRKLIFDLLAQL